LARIVVAGYVVRYPLGGMVWAHLHYVVGLDRLRHEVWFLEDAGGWDDPCYDPDRRDMTADPTAGLAVLDAVMTEFGLGERWAYRDGAGTWRGPAGAIADELMAETDLFLDVGGASYFPEMRRARRRAYVDMDPVFAQLGRFGGDERFREYDVLFTYGANIGRTARVPTRGFAWRPLAPPVVVDLWAQGGRTDDGAIDRRWTTVASLSAYGSVEHDGQLYGQKDVELVKFAELPRLASCELEVAADPAGALETKLAANGWHVADAPTVSRNPWRYRAYVRRSRGEFSVAKNAYVKAQAGWLSDRTATYLASGRPAVVQDTGLPDELLTGGGLLVFRTPTEAAAALHRAEASYDDECRAASALAMRHFDSAKVLDGLLADAL
jgi:hypothetical protein